MRNLSKTRILLLALALAALVGSPALADPLPDQILKFQQLPQNGVIIEGLPYYGHDELSTIYGRRIDTGVLGETGFESYTPPFQPGTYMADDFADKITSEIVHVTWWGSYLNETAGANIVPVKQFLISFETDVADPDFTNPDTYSHPGHPLLNQVVDLTPGPLVAGSGTYTESLITPIAVTGNESLFKYNAELEIPFPQKAHEVYWLKIVALVDPDLDGDIQWGWHNRDYTVEDKLASPAVLPGERKVGELSADGTAPIWHFQDDAVSGVLLSVNKPDPFDPRTDILQEDVWFPQNYQAPWDGPTPIVEYSKDLAFELYAVPEPATWILAGAGLFGLLVARRRRN